VDDAVPDRLDLLHACDHAGVGCGQYAQNLLDGDFVIGHIDRDLDGPVAVPGVFDQGCVEADAFRNAAGEDFAAFSIQQLVLEGRAAGIDDKDLHDSLLLDR
jgi:hypothetical protein